MKQAKSDTSTGSKAVSVRPIGQDDGATVGRFLHEHLNPSVSATDWARVIDPPWQCEAPNRGFQLLHGDDVVGAHLAVYSVRKGIDGPVPTCNLAAFCVLDEFRTHALRLLRALLAQKRYDFLDFSPSGNVIGLNERLGFRRLDTSTRLVANLPDRGRYRRWVTGEPDAVARTVAGQDATVYRDHRHTGAARHVLVNRSGEYAYMMFRRDRRRGFPLFASPLYVGGNRSLLEAAWPSIASHILVEHGLPATLAERRILGFTPGPGLELKNPRPKMMRGSRLSPGAIDYSYSELALVEW